MFSLATRSSLRPLRPLRLARLYLRSLSSTPMHHNSGSDLDQPEAESSGRQRKVWPSGTLQPPQDFASLRDLLNTPYIRFYLQPDSPLLQKEDQAEENQVEEENTSTTHIDPLDDNRLRDQVSSKDSQLESQADNLAEDTAEKHEESGTSQPLVLKTIPPRPPLAGTIEFSPEDAVRALFASQAGKAKRL